MDGAIDPTITYAGPRAEFATVTGSPFWGLAIDEIVAGFKRHGWTHHLGQRLPTPYGLGPQVNHFTTASGRDIIWIPSWGAVQDEEIFTPLMAQRTFWLLWQAGVKVVLCGGTSGTNDWRDPQSEDTVRPGDFVFPWSFYREQRLAGTLPGTELATGLLPRVALMADPFCTALSRDLAQRVQARLVPSPFRRVHSPQTVKVGLHMPHGPGSFETEFETLAWRSLTRMMSQDAGFPHVLLYGDCLSPVLARQLGMHFVYYHVPSNWAQGHPAVTTELLEPLNNLYLNVLPKTCLDLEVEALETWEVPGECQCLENLKERPPVYLQSLSPRA